MLVIIINSAILLLNQYFTNWIRKSSIHYDFKHLTEKYFEIGMKLNDFSIQLVKYCKRAKDGSTAEDLKDRPSKPKNPYRKLTDEDIAEIINLRLDDKNRIESSKHVFVDA